METETLRKNLIRLAILVISATVSLHFGLDWGASAFCLLWLIRDAFISFLAVLAVMIERILDRRKA